jgi:hypothetical protein
MVLQNGYCEYCGKIYTNINHKICGPCHLKNDFTNWTSGNEKIDDFIQEMQLKICKYYSTLFEWIPYDQFNYIKQIRNDDSNDFTTLYSAIWKDGPLEYNRIEWKRTLNKEVILKCVHNSQNITNEIFDDV